MSFLNVLGSLAGGYAQGHEQKIQNDQQQQQFDEQRRLDEANLQAQAEQLRQQKAARGIDPITGQPFVLPPQLTQVRPNNRGKGGAATPQEMLGHYYALANWYASRGDTNQANIALAQAQGIQGQLTAEATQNSQLIRDLINQGQSDWRTLQVQQGMANRFGGPSWWQQWLIGHGYQPSGSPGRTSSTRDNAEASRYYNDFKQLWDKLRFVPQGKVKGVAPIDPRTHLPMLAIMPPEQQQNVNKITAYLDGSTDPLKDAKAILKGVTDKNMIDLIQAYAKYRDAKIRGERDLEQQGGSQAAPPFPG